MDEEEARTEPSTPVRMSQWGETEEPKRSRLDFGFAAQSPLLQVEDLASSSAPKALEPF